MRRAPRHSSANILGNVERLAKQIESCRFLSLPFLFTRVETSSGGKRWLYSKIIILHGTMETEYLLILVGADFFPYLGAVEVADSAREELLGPCPGRSGSNPQGQQPQGQRPQSGNARSKSAAEENFIGPWKKGSPPRGRDLHGSRVLVIRVRRGCHHHEPLFWNCVYAP